jgi:hypothetical protein
MIYFGIPWHPYHSGIIHLDDDFSTYLKGRFGLNKQNVLRDSMLISSSNSSNNGELIVCNTDGSNWYSIQSGNISDCNVSLVYPAYRDLKFGTWSNLSGSNWTEYMRLTKDGKLGIGYSNPSESLQINGGVYVDADNKGLIVDSGNSKRVGLMKYTNRKGGIWRTSNAEFEIGRANVASLDITPSSWTTDLYIGSNGNITIGSSNTNGMFDVHDTYGNTMNLYSYSNGAIIYGRRARGTLVAPQAIKNNDIITAYRAAAYDGVSWSENLASIEVIALEDHTSSAKGTGIVFKTTIPGTTQMASKFIVDGYGDFGVYGNIYSLQTFRAPMGTCELPSYSFSNDPDTGIWSPSSNQIAISTAGYESLRITDTGFIGVGVEAPWTNLHLVGSMFATNTFIAETGSSNLPSYTFSNSSNTGIWSPSNNVLAFSTNSTERMRMDSSGKIGMGVTSPWQNLHLQGSTFVSSSYIAPLGTVSAPSYTFSNATGTGIYCPSSNAIAMTVNGVEKFRVDSSGQFSFGEVKSIGNSYAGGAFIAPQASSNAPSYTFSNNTNTGFYSPSSNIIAATCAGVETVRFNSNGYIGIGTTSPSSLLHLSTPSNASNYCVLSFAPSNGYGIYAQASNISSRGNQIRFMSTDSNSGTVTTRDVLTLRPEGNIGIGTSNPQAALEIVEDYRDNLYDALRLSYSTYTVDKTINMVFKHGTVPTSGKAVINSKHITNNHIDLQFYTTSNEVLASDPVLTISGKDKYLGVGTSNPLSKLHVHQGDVFVSNTTGMSKVTLGPFDGTKTHSLFSSNDDFQISSVSSSSNQGVLTFYTGANNTASERLRLDYNGNMCLGTNSTTSRFHIKGNGSLSNVYTALQIDNAFTMGSLVGLGTVSTIGIANNTNLYMGFNMFYDATNTSYKSSMSNTLPSCGIVFNSSGDIELNTNTATQSNTNITPSSRVIIKNNGKVGINVTPSYQLDVSGDIRTNANLYVTGGNIYPNTSTTTATNMLLNVAGGTLTVNGPINMSSYGISNIASSSFSDVVRINAGSGTTIDTNGLFVYQNTQTTTSHAMISAQVNGATSGNAIMSWDILNATGWCAGVDNADSDKFKIANSTSSLTTNTRLIIDSSGNIGIGASPSNAFKFDIAGATRSTGIIYADTKISFSNNASSAVPSQTTHGGIGDRVVLWPGGTSIYPYSIGINTNTLWHSVPSSAGYLWYSNGTGIMSLSSSGALVTLNDITCFGSVSDIKFKEEIYDLPNSLDKVCELKPVTFKWKNDIVNEDYRGITDIGFIAQDVEPIIPQAIKEVTMNDDTFKTIKYERFIPVLVGAIKELDEKNKQQEIIIQSQIEEIDDLKSRLERVESIIQQYLAV